MRLVCLFVTLNFILSIALSQNISSEWKKFNLGSSAERLNASKNLYNHYNTQNFDTVRIIGEQLFDYGIETHDYLSIEFSKLILADYFCHHGKTQEAIALVKSTLSEMEQRSDYPTLTVATNIVNNCYLLQRDIFSSLYWAKKCFEYGKKSKKSFNKYVSIYALAQAYQLKGDTKSAVEYFNLYTTKMVAKYKFREACKGYAKLGDLYRLSGTIEKAEKQFILSMNCAKKHGGLSPYAHALNNLAIIDFEKGNTELAKEKFIQSMQLRVKLNDPKSIAESYYNMGDYYFYVENNISAETWYKKSIEYARNNQLISEQIDGLNALSNLYKAQNEFEKSTQVLEQSLKLIQQQNKENSKDDNEIMAILNEIRIKELKANILPSETGNSKYEQLMKQLPYEWILISMLTILLIISTFRQKTINSNVPDKTM